MPSVRYIEVGNFKTFGPAVRVDLSHPAVLIGPNNAGKTSVIQALALWSRGVRAWYERKGQPRKEALERLSAGINRLDIIEVPVQDTRFFWHNARVSKANSPVQLTVCVGLEVSGCTSSCRMVFTRRDSEVIYARPCEETVQNEELLKAAASLRTSLLYPMSGIDTEEPLVQEGRINVLMGLGQTAQVLRNLCYMVSEADPADWEAISDLLQRVFAVKLSQPALDSQRGAVVLRYSQEGVDRQLDVCMAGRGLQQMLLILAYLYSHKNSVLMIDEPDAHLEILRQRQVYEILRDVALRNHCQVIIATHSEVILENAQDTNLTLLLGAEAVNLATQQDIRLSLREIGVEHYYRAKTNPRILYLEGSTDLSTLRVLARRLGHPAEGLLAGNLNCYYTRDISAMNTLESRLDRVGGAFPENVRQHFYTIRRCVTGLRGIALLDKDAMARRDDVKPELAVLYWPYYELENCYLLPSLVVRYVTMRTDEDLALFSGTTTAALEEIVRDLLIRKVFGGDEEQYDGFQKSSPSLQRTVLQSTKMSEFAEEVFETLAERTRQPVMLRKGEFSQLAELADPTLLPKEITDRLDMLMDYLGEPASQPVSPPTSVDEEPLDEGDP